MDEIRVLSPTGACGSGFLESSFERRSPETDFIGSSRIDRPGPAYLGSGRTAFPKAAIRRDLRLASKARGVCGFRCSSESRAPPAADTRSTRRRIIEDIAAAKDLSFKLALIHTEQDKTTSNGGCAKAASSRSRPRRISTQAAIDRSEHIVGMMGAEPFIQALQAGADVVLAGRSSDTAIFAAIPVMRGFPGRTGLARGENPRVRRRARSSIARRPTACSRGSARITSWSRRPTRTCAAPAEHRFAQPVRERRSIRARRMLRHARPHRFAIRGDQRSRGQGDGQQVHSRARATPSSSKAPRRSATRASCSVGARSVHHPPDRRLACATGQEDQGAHRHDLRRQAQAGRVPLQRAGLWQERHDGPARAGEGDPFARAVSRLRSDRADAGNREHDSGV